LTPTKTWHSATNSPRAPSPKLPIIAVGNNWTTATSSALPEQKYNVLIMLDKGIPHQQNMTGFDIAVVTLDAGYPGGTAEQKALMPTVNRLLPDVRPGEVYPVTPSGTSRP
jgi:hypothetical protein